MSEVRITRSRPRIDGRVHCDVVRNAEAKGLPELADFCCGQCALEPSAAEVNAIAASLFGGEQQWPMHVVLLRDRLDVLLGIAAVRPEGAVRFDPVPYLAGYGREKGLKRSTLADGKTGLGEALLRAGIELVTPADGPTPEMQALVMEDNQRSQRPIEAIGFRRADPERLQAQIQGAPPPGFDISQIKLPSFFT